jgi:hypothetical protein
MSEQTFIIISCTSTYGVHLCVKFNKNTLGRFEGLQDLWTDGRTGRFLYTPKLCRGIVTCIYLFVYLHKYSDRNIL